LGCCGEGEGQKGGRGHSQAFHRRDSCKMIWDVWECEVVGSFVQVGGGHVFVRGGCLRRGYFRERRRVIRTTKSFVRTLNWI
jgi:hypothetical protein